MKIDYLKVGIVTEDRDSVLVQYPILNTTNAAQCVVGKSQLGIADSDKAEIRDELLQAIRVLDTMDAKYRKEFFGYYDFSMIINGFDSEEIIKRVAEFQNMPKRGDIYIGNASGDKYVVLDVTGKTVTFMDQFAHTFSENVHSYTTEYLFVDFKGDEVDAIFKALE